MKNIIYNLSDLELLNKFIHTNDPIYCYNLLVRYFYYNMSVEMNKFRYIYDFNEINLEQVFDFYKNEYNRLIKVSTGDRTIYYSLDLISNIELFRHFLKYPWSSWNDKIVIECGVGFGIYTYLFNLIKMLFNVNLSIHSIDYSEYKIKKLEKISGLLQWSDNVIKCADAREVLTFDGYDGNVKLIYSETFSMFDVSKENYFLIKDNLEKCFDFNETILFPKDFVIENDSIKSVVINGVYRNLSNFRVDNRSQNIMNDLLSEYPKIFGFRWGKWGL